MKKLYIIDAVNILYRAYYAIRPMTNPKGESTNALFGFIRSVYKLIKDYSSDHIIAVFDGPESKKERLKIYSEYKAHRATMADDLFPQLLKCIEFCKIAGIPYIAVPGVEADDTIGSMALWAEKQGAEVFICTSDKDLAQVVSDHIFLINLDKENLIFDRKKVEEFFGVKPEQIVDYLAIMGDASDNIPGIAGFGPKTASSLLQQFGTLENLLTNSDKVSGKKGEVLATSKEVALLSKQLATIHIGVDFPKEEEFFRLKEPDIDQVKTFYHEMHFLTLLKELENAQPQKVETEETLEYITVNDQKELDDLITLLNREKEICLDTETTDISPMLAEMVGIGFCLHPKKAWYVPLNGTLGKEKVLATLADFFQNTSAHFYGHNIKYDLHVLLNAGLNLPKICFDTLLASYLLNPQNQRHGLDQICLEKFGKVKISIESLIGKGKNQISMEQVPLEQITNYCCEDVDYTTRLKTIFEKDLEKIDLTKILKDIELPLLPVLLGMERHGIYVDRVKLEKMSQEFKILIAALEEEIHQLAGESFNVSSPKQLSVILFEKMGLKPPKKTATGFSTSADALESLQDSHPIVKKVLEYRTLEKLRSTYIDSLPTQINPKTNRIHCTFNQSVAATGRLSSQDPNLQNIPIRSPLGRQIRGAFRPQKSGWSFLAADYSQIELRLLAHFCEDPALLTAFKEDQDVHAYTASLVFGVPLEDVTSEMRYQAKAVNFGILYGQGAFGLSQVIGVDYKEAAAFIETYFERYKRVKEYLEFCKETARKTGKVATFTGRQRPIPDINNSNPMIRSAAERLAVNTPLQGTAADLIKIAMIDIDLMLKKNPELGTMILQIHDELLFEAPDEHLTVLSSQVKKIMEGVFSLKVPLVVEISIGKNWGEC